MIKKNIMPMLLIGSIIIINILSMLLGKLNLLGVLSSMTGVISAVMVSKGHISCYYFGIINNLAYMLIAYTSHFYGSAALQLFIMLPMQIMGIYNWRSNLNEEKLVKVRKLSIKKLLIITTFVIITTLISSYILNIVDGNLVIIDAGITFASIVAMYLTVKRYKEQWHFWIVVNILYVTIWGISFYNNSSNSLLMLLTYILYLINSIYGLINWHKLMLKEGK